MAQRYSLDTDLLPRRTSSPQVVRIGEKPLNVTDDGDLIAVEQRGATLNHGQVVVGTTATLIAPANRERYSVLILNNSGVVVYIGSSLVSTQNGYQLAAGLAISFKTRAAIYGIVASGLAASGWLEESL